MGKVLGGHLAPSVVLSPSGGCSSEGVRLCKVCVLVGVGRGAGRTEASQGTRLSFSSSLSPETLVTRACLLRTA